jgi:hypothetical protein
MPPLVIERTVPRNCYSEARNRPVRGVFWHHTASAFDPFPSPSGSWHYLITRAGDIYVDVPVRHVAYTVKNTDRWRPPWVVRGPGGFSDANWCGVQVEVTFAPQQGQTPTVAQHDAARFLVDTILIPRFGRLPSVGHGQVQPDKWPTEPHGWSWARAGWEPDGPLPFASYRYRGFTPPPDPPAQEEDMPLPTPVLDDARLVAAQAAIWGPAWDAAQADFGVPATWRAAMRAGYDLGAPIGDEQHLGDGAVFRRFERGTVFWTPERGGSWNG